jgi:hypothetical protein
MLVKCFEVSTLALGSFSVFAGGLLIHAPQRFLNRSANSALTERGLGSGKEFFV